MAKYGEGDKRWIVEERSDGTNVHNWHWAEKDCLEWSRNMFKSLFTDLILVHDFSFPSDDEQKQKQMEIKVSNVDKVEGDSYINIRKGKIIPGYELSLSLTWIATTTTNDKLNNNNNNDDEKERENVSVSGKVLFPYIADENADEEPEVRVTVASDSSEAERLRQVVFAKGRQVLFAKIKEFVKSINAGGPMKDEFEGKDVGNKPAKTATGTATVVKDAYAAPTSAAATKEKEKEKEKGIEGFKTIKLTERFHCRPSDIYEILLDENRWKAFSQSNARISKEIGGGFSFFDGAVTGVTEQLEPNKLIVQKWRFANWADGIFSKVTLCFEEPEVGTTIVKLTQSNVPEEDRYGNETVIENTERGWRDLIFHRIRAVFGYGI